MQPTDITPVGLAGLPQNQGLGPLKRTHVMPPFSVWDTRQDDWGSRKKLWLARGMASELGRAGDLTYSVDERYEYAAKVDSRTSIFDPVVCELAYRWWCPVGGIVLDPFAGGCVRGCVASVLGYKYLGLELRTEQVQANKAQLWENPNIVGQYPPIWLCGDSRQVLLERQYAGRPLPTADFVFSCPPYGDLEVYSDDPRDISNMSYTDFLATYRDIIALTARQMQPNSFAVWVVGNYRDSKGRMIDFVGDTVRAWQDAGLAYYNDIVLINKVGSGAVRANTTFGAARKVIKLHQNVLVFVLGDPKLATDKIKPVE